jgi:lysophospholipase L1-like esterase
MGASNVEGVGDEERRGWAGRLTVMEPAKDSKIGFFNLGVGGDTTAMIRARWKAEIAARITPERDGAIVMSFGLNDTAEVVGQGLRLPMRETIENVRAVAQEARDWKPMIWVGPTPVDESMMPLRRPGIEYSFTNARLVALNDSYAEIADKLKIPYMDLLSPLMADARYTESLRKVDGLHPSGSGYQIIADMIAGWTPWRAFFD